MTTREAFRLLFSGEFGALLELPPTELTALVLMVAALLYLVVIVLSAALIALAAK